MRYIVAFTLVLTVLLAACGSPRMQYKRQTTLLGVDLTPYAENGFLITPEDYQGEYEAVGILSFEILPEMTRSKVEEQAGQVADYTNWEVGDLDTQDAVDSLYSRAQEMGADAIIRFKTEQFSERIEGGVRIGVRARGFAIDRVDD